MAVAVEIVREVHRSPMTPLRHICREHPRPWDEPCDDQTCVAFCGTGRMGEGQALITGPAQDVCVVCFECAERSGR